MNSLLYKKLYIGLFKLSTNFSIIQYKKDIRKINVQQTIFTITISLLKIILFIHCNLGFRRLYSTFYASISLTEDIRKNLYKGNIGCCGISVDL